MRRTLVLELNEFNNQVLIEGARIHGLTHIKSVLAMHHSRTICAERIEGFDLDPWNQWVSVHTGLTVSEHGVRHLDQPSKNLYQIWERLSGANVRWGVWGPPNATIGDSEFPPAFFVPDPWSSDQVATPKQLEKFLSLPRYYAKNYLNSKRLELLVATLRTLNYCLQPNHIAALIRELPLCVSIAWKSRLKDYGLFNLFDLVNTINFISWARKEDTHRNILYLNALAHTQHHHWDEVSLQSGALKQSLECLNCILGMLLNEFSNSRIVILNALSQQQEQATRFLYKPKKPEQLLAILGIEYRRIETLMTHDAYLYFDSSEDMKIAKSQLQRVQVERQSLFDVQDSDIESKCLFFQIGIWDDLPENAVIKLGKTVIVFYDHIQKINKRTGSHTWTGDVYCNDKVIPNEVRNSEVLSYVFS